MSYYQQAAEGGAGSFGRHELIGWLNASLGLRMSRIEDVGNGAAACQIIDVLHPDAGMKLSRVNFAARDAYEIEKNYKHLQHAFVRAGIEKKLDVEKLIEGKPMALLGTSARARPRTTTGRAPHRALRRRAGDALPADRRRA